jgi:hypothetical protein
VIFACAVGEGGTNNGGAQSLSGWSGANPTLTERADNADPGTGSLLCDGGFADGPSTGGATGSRTVTLATSAQVTANAVGALLALTQDVAGASFPASTMLPLTGLAIPGYPSTGPMQATGVEQNALGYVTPLPISRFVNPLSLVMGPQIFPVPAPYVIPVAGTTFNDSGTGTITLSGTGVESQTHSSSSAGTITLSGTRTESQTQTGSGTGTITLRQRHRVADACRVRCGDGDAVGRVHAVAVAYLERHRDGDAFRFRRRELPASRRWRRGRVRVRPDPGDPPSTPSPLGEPLMQRLHDVRGQSSAARPAHDTHNQQTSTGTADIKTFTAPKDAVAFLIDVTTTDAWLTLDGSTPTTSNRR